MPRGDALVAAIKQSQAPVLVVRSTQVTEAMLDAGALSLIVRAGAGVNTIDVAAASKRGIYVSNCPGKNAVAVAELTMGLILALDRRHARQRRRAARRHLEQEGILEGEGPDGPDARPARLRPHRPGGRASARARSACRCWCGAAASATTRRRATAAEEEFDIEIVRFARSADGAVRHRQRAPGADEGHARLRRTPTLLQARQAGRLLHQHRPRRSGGLRARSPTR